MEYFNIEGTKEETFVLFHGTGGNEYSLFFLTGELDPKANLLSFLGNVGSGAERRFFKPLVEGKLDREDFDRRVDEFLINWPKQQPQTGKITFIGYSNGANFILGLLAKNKQIADQVLLLHPSQLDYHFENDELIKTKILMTTGATDYLVTPGSVLTLNKELKKHFKQVDFLLLDQGHGVDDGEIEAVKTWYQKNN